MKRFRVKRRVRSRPESRKQIQVITAIKVLRTIWDTFKTTRRKLKKCFANNATFLPLERKTFIENGKKSGGLVKPPLKLIY